MLAVAFDTLKLARKLESAGMQSKQAQDTSAALSETFTEWLSVGNIATREDVREMRTELHEVKAELKADIGKLDAKIDNAEARLETKIEAKKTEILYWMVGQTIVLLGALFALIHFPGAH